MKVTLILAVFVHSVVSVAAEENDSLLVPRPVLDFMMGCKKRSLSDSDEPLVPVYRTDISAESGTTSQHVSLLGVDELQASLKAAIESDVMTDHIMNKIKQEFSTGQEALSSFRQDCPVTHTINIDVPPQELEVFHTRMERVMQQNNNILLGLINDMISTKFTYVQRDLSNLINERITNIDLKLTDILARLPAPEGVSATPSPTANLKDEDALADSVATESPKLQPDNSKPDDLPVTNAFAEIVQAIKAANKDEATKVANQDEASKVEDEDQEDGTAESTSSSSDTHDSMDTTTRGPGRESMQGEGNKFISNLSQLLQRPVAFER